MVPLRPLLPVFCVLVAALSTAQEPLSPLQTVSLRRAGSPMVSPDGSQVAFVRLEPRLADAGPGPDSHHLWIMPSSGGPGTERRLLGPPGRFSGPAFRPDGSAISFVDQREGDAHREVYELPLAGGEPLRVTRTDRGVRSYAWSPDGRFIAYTSTDPQPADRLRARSLGFRQEVVDEDWTHTSLWLWDVSKRSARRLTSGATVFAFEWAPDGSKLALGLAPRALVDDSYMFVRLWSLDRESGDLTKLVDNPGKLGGFAWSPDGTRLAYISAQNPRDPHAGMLYVVDEEGVVTILDDDIEGMFHSVVWEDDRVVAGVMSRGVFTHRYRAWPGMYLQTTPSAVVFSEAVTDPRTGVAYATASTPTHPEELYRLRPNGKEERMTDSNPWLASVALGEQTVERIRARDGLEIEGLLMHPVSGTKGEGAPLVIVAHGGPEAHFSHGWLTSYAAWGQILAGRGYYVWYPNYRASTGRGVRFAMADHGDPMGAEFHDHLDAIAAFAERGLIDVRRVGIGGGSYGGYTAAWAATRHSEHFAAAVSFVPFVDIRTKWMTSDIPWEFYYVHYEEKWPWEQAAFLAERSPLTYAANCRTPLLLLGGTDDTRVHPSQPHMLYRAVERATETPVRYVRYPGEGHGNRTNVYRYDYLIRSLRWLEHYLAPGDQRRNPSPPLDLDYGEWAATKTTTATR